MEDADGWFIYLRDLADGAFWSAGARPVPGAPETYDTEDGPGWVAITRRERGIESRMDVWVDPDVAAECRRITLENRTDRHRTLDLTSYIEVVLHDPRHHAAHPAFSKLFVQTGFVARGEALLAWRRPRGIGERHPFLAQALRGEGSLGYATDRVRFLGRGRGPEAPLALASRDPLSGMTGDVLDPVFALRRIVELPPGATARLELVLAAAPDREEALVIVDRLDGVASFQASRDTCIARATGRRIQHGWSMEEGASLERLAAAMLTRDPSLRPPREAVAPVEGSLALERHPPIPLRGAVVVTDVGAPASTVGVTPPSPVMTTRRASMRSRFCKCPPRVRQRTRRA